MRGRERERYIERNTARKRKKRDRGWEGEREREVGNATLRGFVVVLNV